MNVSAESALRACFPIDQMSREETEETGTFVAPGKLGKGG